MNLANLDEKGLTYLWNKIKNYVDSKISSSGGVTVTEYSPDDFNFNSFYQIMEFQCYRVGRMVFLNMELYIKSGTTVLSNTVYGFNWRSIPAEIKPSRNTLLQGFCCDGDFGNATQISSYVVGSTGIIKYSLPVVRSYIAVQGFWLVD